MKIAIFGTGGVGGYFGGRLAQAGHDVVFLARGPHLAAIQQNGLRVESIAGDFVIAPARATDDPHAVGEVDVIIVATKAWDVPAAAHALHPMIGARTVVLPLQNGVDAIGQIASVIGSQHVLGGMCRISALIRAPGVIQHVGVQPYVALGELDGRQTDRVAALRAAFAACAGLTVDVPADIHTVMWEKFIFIAAISGVGAVTRQPAGVFRSVPESRALLLSALEETTAVARAMGIRVPELVAQKTLEFIDQAAPGLMASMQRDIMEGRPSELDSQNGAVVRMGRVVGVPTPVHQFLYASLLPMELKARGKI